MEHTKQRGGMITSAPLTPKKKYVLKEVYLRQKKPLVHPNLIYNEGNKRNLALIQAQIFNAVCFVQNIKFPITLKKQRVCKPLINSINKV